MASTSEIIDKCNGFVVKQDTDGTEVYLKKHNDFFVQLTPPAWASFMDALLKPSGGDVDPVALHTFAMTWGLERA
jgi:hypothetical protein